MDLNEALLLGRRVEFPPDEYFLRPQCPSNHLPIQWKTTEEILAPVPTHPWVVPTLQLGPGRPMGLIAKPYSAKTLIAQTIALSVASGKKLWGHFDVAQTGTVKHCDYEQGAGTVVRYQRLMRGHQIEPSEVGDRLKLASHPKLWLDKSAKDAWSYECHGVTLMILDALRGCMPSVEENSSALQEHFEKLIEVSAETGCSFLVLHHTTKGQGFERAAIETIRGSAAIAAVMGSTFVIDSDESDIKTLRHIKSHPSACGGCLDAFKIKLSDVGYGGDRYYGLHLGYLTSAEAEEAAGTRSASIDTAMLDRAKCQIVELLRTGPTTMSRIRLHCKCRYTISKDAVDELLTEGKVVFKQTGEYKGKGVYELCM